MKKWDYLTDYVKDYFYKKNNQRKILVKMIYLIYSNPWEIKISFQNVWKNRPDQNMHVKYMQKIENNAYEN